MQVPFGPKPDARQRPPVDPTFLAMAAADLHDAGMLYQPNIEDRRNQGPEDIGPIVQYPGEQLPMHAVTKLGAEAGAQDLDNVLVDKWLKDRGK